MIEAVTSAISNSTVSRASVEQLSGANSFAADPVAVESVAKGPRAPFVSPYVQYDTNFDTAVLQIRDSETGDVLKQFPTEQTLQRREFISSIEQGREQRPLFNFEGPEVQSVDVSSQGQGAGDVSAFQTAVIVSAQSSSGENPTSTAGAAQTAIAAFSAGALSGQAVSAQVSVTA